MPTVTAGRRNSGMSPMRQQLKIEAKCRHQSTRKHPTSEASVFDTLRSVILNRYPQLAALVQERFPGNPTGEEAFAYALELFLLVNFNSAFDGWKMFRLVNETAASLRAVGIMHVLPGSELPVEITLSTDLQGVRYQVQIGIDDSQWQSLSNAKRWKAVYLYASGERDEEWAWSNPISGCLSDG